MPTRSSPPSLDSLLCFAVYSAGLALGRTYRPLLEALDLTYPQYVAMVALWNRDGQTVGALCEALFLTTSTLTPVLKKLEAKGLLRRTRGPADDREVHVRLTEAGTALAARAAPLPECIQDASGLGSAALGDLSAAMSRLRDQLLAPSPPMPPAARQRAARAATAAAPRVPPARRRASRTA